MPASKLKDFFLPPQAAAFIGLPDGVSSWLDLLVHILRKLTGTLPPPGDTTPPAAPMLMLVNDTGSSGNDGVTADGTIAVTGLEPDASWEYSPDDGNTWIAGTGNSFTVTGAGEQQVLVRQRDAAGNESSITALAFVLYTLMPTLAELDGSNGFRLDGVAAEDHAGYSVSSAGDINGDGHDDLIVGANEADPGQFFNDGSSYVVFGQADGYAPALALSALDGNNGFRLDGVSPGGWAGAAVSSAGDLNGDGYDDFVVGAPRAGDASTGGYYAGATYVVFGKAAPFAATMALSTLDGSNGFRLTGESEGAAAGYSVSNAGDINGDGYDDLLVGSRFAYPDGVILAGSSYVVFGKAAGFSATLSLDALDGSDGFRIDGEAQGDIFGFAVSGAGDVNGDGFDDFLMGAHLSDPGGVRNAGAAYLVFGKASGFGASLALDSLDGSNGFRLDGIGVEDRAGAVVSGVGDLNGDGYADFAVGGGTSYVVFGKASGFAASMVLDTVDGSNGFRLEGGVAAISGAGDVNGDGYDDLVIGAPGARNGSLLDVGAAYVVFGKAGGFSAVIDLAALPDQVGSDGFRIGGLAAGDRLGSSVSSAGDLNNDGYADLIIGASMADAGGLADAGTAYVLFGKPMAAEDAFLEGADAGLVLSSDIDFSATGLPYSDGNGGTNDSLAPGGNGIVLVGLAAPPDGVG